jgi:hypothetical protein
MSTHRVEAMRALCADLDDSIQMAREGRAPMRALLLIELARDDLLRSIDEIERVTPWSKNGRQKRTGNCEA